MRNDGLGPLLILAAALLWGTTGTAQALGPPAHPLAVGGVRLLVGAAGLVAVAAVTGRLRPHAAVPWPALAATALGIAAYQPLFFAGVSRVGVALGTLVAIGSGPVFTGLLAAAARTWRPSPRWLSATVLALVGIALVAGTPGAADLPGILFAAGAGASYAVYATGSKRLLGAFPPLGAMAWCFGGGALLLAPVLATADLSWLGTGPGVAMAAWLGLATTTGSYVLFGYGLRSTDVPVAATLSLAEPLTAAVLGVAVLGERPSPPGWVGAGLILAGLILLGRSPRRSPRPSPT